MIAHMCIYFLFISCAVKKPSYLSLNTAPPADISEWDIELSGTPKTALLIFPHPDDEIICAGTITKMQQAGWSVNLLTLTQGSTNQDKLIRKAEWQASGKVLGYANMQIHDFLNNSWDAILGDSVRFWNESRDTLKSVIYNHIQKINPHIIITYDDIIGGYGHPEHKITAELVHELFSENLQTFPFDVMQLFQFTLTPDLERFNLSEVATYQKALSSAKSATLLPIATTFVNIEPSWPTKAAAARCYVSQRQTLEKFYLLPSDMDTLSHYRTFNMEYFHEVKR